MKSFILILLGSGLLTSTAYAADISDLTVGKTIVFTGETSVLDVTLQRHSPRVKMATQYTAEEQFGDFFAFHKTWISVPAGTTAIVVRQGRCRYEGGRSSLDTQARCAALIKVADRFFALMNSDHSSGDYERDEAVARIFPKVGLVGPEAAP